MVNLLGPPKVDRTVSNPLVALLNLARCRRRNSWPSV
jgi:hypothetical protein